MNGSFFLLFLLSTILTSCLFTVSETAADSNGGPDAIVQQSSQGEGVSSSSVLGMNSSFLLSSSIKAIEAAVQKTSSDQGSRSWKSYQFSPSTKYSSIHIVGNSSSSEVQSSSSEGQRSSSQLLSSSIESSSSLYSSNDDVSSMSESSTSKKCALNTIHENEFCDIRDDQIYKYTGIGTQTWMAENLNYDLTARKGCGSQNDLYGYLYTWDNAINSCPNGWHLPSKLEWETLFGFVAVESGLIKKDSTNNNLWIEAARALMTITGWEAKDDGMPVEGLNLYDFSALPAGSCHPYEDIITGVGTESRWWVSDKVGGGAFDSCIFSSGSMSVECASIFEYGRSVRCIKDSP